MAGRNPATIAPLTHVDALLAELFSQRFGTLPTVESQRVSSSRDATARNVLIDCHPHCIEHSRIDPIHRVSP